MKNIKVTEEVYDFLMELSKELNTQDNRATADPYFFQVRETKQVPAHPGSGEEIYYSQEAEIELSSYNEKIDYIRENGEDMDLGDYDIESIDVLNEFDLDFILEDNGFESYNVDYEHTYSNAFLTSKACDEHIRINGHNLQMPANFLSHAYRNPELEKVIKFIKSLTPKK